MSGDFEPSAPMMALQQRAEILRQIRRFFDQRGFFEVETPVLSRDVIVDRYIEPIAVSATEIGIAEPDSEFFWLQTSPEFAMKRLLAAGADAIYQITRAFRAGETGQLHNPEFTILEWYQCGDSTAAAMKLLGELAMDIFQTDAFDCLSYRDAFWRHIGIDGLEPDSGKFAAVARKAGLDTAGLNAADDVDQWRNLLLAQVIEPQLGSERPVILFDYPASQAALAIVREEKPPVAERFELYYRGIELANGYHELLDAAELQRRNRANHEHRLADGRRALPTDSRLAQAMRAGLPDCSGVALGVDRLVMVACGYDSIHEVVAFPISIA